MELDLIGLIWQASLVVKLVMLLLAGMSVGSWAIIVLKWRELRRAEADSEAFLEVYREEEFARAFEAARELDRSPLAAVFLGGCAELQQIAKKQGGGAVDALEVEQVRRVRKALGWITAGEAQRFERGLSFLATTGSSAPFIGLFGTVIGIIASFESIGRAGSASLAVVAPGIAEALIATAVGLFAAIPATIFYNSFVARIEQIGAAIDLFRGDFEQDLDLVAAQATGARASARRERG
ncbi:MAG: MotA/TolQ/ExbB proton channel family protein [Myxococcota bacterium]|nr:MotA/TolQ/ExbB proton channel family protein [Myxococcales bacterium]